MSYNSVITAIAEGASRLNEIATKVGIESGPCSKYVRTLMELSLIHISGGYRICPQVDDGAFFDSAGDSFADSHPDGVCGDAAVCPKRVDAAGVCMAD